MKLSKSVLTLVGACALTTLLTGCSSIICGSKQSFSINSKPAGAEVLVYDPHGEIVFQKTTPCVASLARTTPEEGRANYTVLIRKAGYAPVQVPLISQVNRACVANAVFGGVGMIVDSATGAMWTLSPQGLDPELVDQNATSFHSDSDLMVRLKPQTEQQAGLVAHVEPVEHQAIVFESLTRAVRVAHE
jgi:hypothetical protein